MRTPTFTSPAQVSSASAPYSRRSVWTLAIGVGAFVTLTIVGANISIPLRPVPITLQTLFVVLAGAILGSRAGASSQALYLGLGAMGIPVFAGGVAGSAIFTGHTAGYLLGFLVAPIVVGRLLPHARSKWAQFLVFYVGSQTILCLGVIVLRAFFVEGFADALRVGYLPFVPGDLLKTLAAVSIYRSYRGIVAARRSR